MVEPAHPDGWMWVEGIAANNELLLSDAQQRHHYAADSEFSSNGPFICFRGVVVSDCTHRRLRSEKNSES